MFKLSAWGITVVSPGPPSWSTHCWLRGVLDLCSGTQDGGGEVFSPAFANRLEGLAGAEGLLLASCLHDSATSASFPRHQIMTPPVATLGQHGLAVRQDMLEVRFDSNIDNNGGFDLNIALF